MPWTRILCLSGAAVAAPALGDVKVTDRQHVRHDGGQDATTLACSVNNRQQNGNVYVCWAQFTASGPNNGVFFSRSTDGGRTFSNRMKVSESVHGSQFGDIAVGRTGRVWVAWRQFEFFGDRGQQQRDAVAYVYSDDGGRSFTKPALATEFTHWDMGDTAGDPGAFGRAGYEACLAGDGTLGRCAGPDPRVNTRDCGDGPFECRSGYVFGRVASSVRIAADPTPGADPDAAYALVDATVPGTETPTGTTYSTVSDGVGSQASTYLVKTTDGGGSWSTSRVDPQPKGHQFYSDVDAYAGRLHVVYHDTRSDTATGPPGTAGDFRIVPFSNRWVGGAVGSTHTNQGVETWYSRSTDGGATWARQRVSSTSYALDYEQFGNRDVPFFGDYNYISATASNVLMTWPSGQDVVVGTDPRYTDGNGTDGFDVLQCRTFASGAWSADTCPNAGGLDTNIYGFVGP